MLTGNYCDASRVVGRAGGFDSGHLSGYSINPLDEPTFTSTLASNRADSHPQK